MTRWQATVLFQHSLQDFNLWFHRLLYWSNFSNFWFSMLNFRVDLLVLLPLCEVKCLLLFLVATKFVLIEFFFKFVCAQSWNRHINTTEFKTNAIINITIYVYCRNGYFLIIKCRQLVDLQGLYINVLSIHLSSHHQILCKSW